MASSEPATFNLVILPTTPHAAGGQLFQLSATARDRSAHLVSPQWTEPELRRVFVAADIPQVQLEELMRGNARASGRRDAPRLFFTATQLTRMGLVTD